MKRALRFFFYYGIATPAFMLIGLVVMGVGAFVSIFDDDDEPRH